MRDFRVPVRCDRGAAELLVGARRGSRTIVTLALGVTLLAGCGSAPEDGQDKAASPVSPQPVSKAQRAKLPKATTHATLKKAPKDPKPSAPNRGRVVHPTKGMVVYSSPGGAPLAILPKTQLENPTWVPVVERQSGWARVLLPSRPNHSTGWLYTAGGGLKVRHTPYTVKVDLSDRKLTLTKNSSQVGSWTVAIGTSKNPTPTGRTFMLASLAPPNPTYSPLILPLGTHSNTLSTYGGGPGTVGFHTWQDSSVFGKAVSHGCVRVPEPALQALSSVPLGSLVLVTK